jgi:hypothetical protein
VKHGANMNMVATISLTSPHLSVNSLAVIAIQNHNNTEIRECPKKKKILY